MFFSSTNLFQVGPLRTRPRRRPGPTVCCFQREQAGRALISYVVASSVGNLSIRDLAEPVRIQIAHLSEQVDAGVVG